MRKLTSKSALLASAATLLVFTSAEGQERHAYFGETHVHTGWSFDAYIFGNTMTGPADAYKYAKGEPIKHPLGYDIKIDTPLDWMGVTDHSEYVGTVKLANTPGSAISKLPIAEKLIVTHAQRTSSGSTSGSAQTIIDNKPIKELISSAKSPDRSGSRTSTSPTRPTSRASSRPSAPTNGPRRPNNRNMHRNVFFKDCAKVPATPFSSIDSQRSRRTSGTGWTASARPATSCWRSRTTPTSPTATCSRPRSTRRAGRSTPPGRQSRDRNERLTEIKQIKGASETHPLLSPNDEFANFEILTYLLGDPAGRFPQVPGSYVRQALKDGLAMQEAARLQPLQDRLRRRLGFAQHRRALPPGQLLRRPWAE